MEKIYSYAFVALVSLFFFLVGAIFFLRAVNALWRHTAQIRNLKKNAFFGIFFCGLAIFTKYLGGLLFRLDSDWSLFFSLIFFFGFCAALRGLIKKKKSKEGNGLVVI